MRAGKRLAEHENARKKADRRADVLDEPDKRERGLVRCGCEQDERHSGNRTGQHQKNASLPCLKRHVRREKHTLTSNSHCNESHDRKRQRNDSLDCNGGDGRISAALLHRSVYAERKGENQGYPGKTAVVYREVDDARCRQYRSCNLQRRQTLAEHHEPQDNRYERVDVVSQRRLHYIVRHHSNDVEAPVQHDEKPRGNKESPCAGVSQKPDEIDLQDEFARNDGEDERPDNSLPDDLDGAHIVEQRPEERAKAPEEITSNRSKGTAPRFRSACFRLRLHLVLPLRRALSEAVLALKK